MFMQIPSAGRPNARKCRSVSNCWGKQEGAQATSYYIQVFDNSRHNMFGNGQAVRGNRFE